MFKLKSTSKIDPKQLLQTYNVPDEYDYRPEIFNKIPEILKERYIIPSPWILDEMNIPLTLYLFNLKVNLTEFYYKDVQYAKSASFQIGDNIIPFVADKIKIKATHSNNNLYIPSSHSLLNSIRQPRTMALVLEEHEYVLYVCNIPINQDWNTDRFTIDSFTLTTICG
jgi:hypothetical protein